MAHVFETSHIDKTPFSETDRLSYDDVLTQKGKLEQQTAFLALSERMGSPLLVLNSHKQVVYANETALDCVNEHDHPDHVLGLRFGEFLGRNHKFNGKICQDPSSCANCNELSAIISALGGEFAEAEGVLSLFECNPNDSLEYTIKCIPFAFEQERYTLLELIPIKV